MTSQYTIRGNFIPSQETNSIVVWPIKEYTTRRITPQNVVFLGHRSFDLRDIKRNARALSMSGQYWV